jgi:predicted transcriptional regulator
LSQSGLPEVTIARLRQLDDGRMACHIWLGGDVKRTTIYLDDHTRERLQRLAEASGRTQAAVIREAIAVYSSTRGGPRVPRSVGMGASAAGDLSERAEELLEGFGRDS